MEKELFSLYYINLDKVYELRMIRNNFIQENRILENRIDAKSTHSVNAGLSSSLKGILSSDIGVTSSFDSLKSVRISDSFAVKQTKSNILSDILEMEERKDNLSLVSDGELIRLDNLKLKLENEQLIRLFKILSQNIIKGQVANGIDINKALNSLAKDYSYLLSTTFNDKNIIIKIPMSADGEFENKYSIDDLLIGNICIIGVYKGTIKGAELNSNFDFFANLGNIPSQTNNMEDEIQSSSEENLVQPYALSTTLKENGEYVFIDLLAIFQSIKVKKTVNLEEMTKKTCFLKKLFRRKKK